MNRASGLTLIEVLLAIAILAVGVLAAAGLQTTALGTNRRVRALQEVTDAANSEIQLQRSMWPPQDGACQATGTVNDRLECVVEVVSCPISDSGSSCSEADPNAYLVTVRARATSGENLELKTVVTQ